MKMFIKESVCMLDALLELLELFRTFRTFRTI